MDRQPAWSARPLKGFFDLPDHRPALERARIAWLFDRHPRRASFIAREVARRMGERLGYIRIEPRHVLDAGCGSGADWKLLKDRFPAALAIGTDFSAGRLGLARRDAARHTGWRERLLARRSTQFAAVCADFARLPFANGRFDMIWSNLAIHWDEAAHRALTEWARVLQPGGLVMFSAFGPDTLAEVRRIFALVDDQPHTLAFTDMHDYGDMLIAGGFATPVVDMEHITLTYTEAGAFWEDVRALGGNPLVARRRGLWGRAGIARLNAAVEGQRGSDGLLRLTFEVLYGHAWKGVPRTRSDGRAIVRDARPGAGAGSPGPR
jgi:malonyl-CoA O-methyltransferase